MEERKLLKALALPKETHVLRTFPFNRLAPRLSTRDKKFFRETVEPHGVRLLATINTNITNIPVYEDEDVRYQEIHIFQVMMKDIKHAKKIYQILAEAMPYPLFIRFVSSNKIEWIGATHQKVEKTGLLKIQEMYNTNPKIDEQKYIINWAFFQSDTYNLKAFYENLLHQMVQIELTKTYGSITDKSLEKNIARLHTIKVLEKEITSYITKARKEAQMNKRIEWQMKANELKTKKENYIKGEI